MSRPLDRAPDGRAHHADPRVRLRPVDARADAALLHGWVSQDGASFWGMSQADLEEVTAIYAYIAEQEHLTASIAELDGRPLALLQTYDPAVDEIGRFYDRRPGDLGVHLLLADDPARAGRTTELLRAVMAWLAGTGARRLVLEPDARNERSLALLDRLGAQRGPAVEVVTSYSRKPAQFCFLDPIATLARLDG